jgi:hypothetical protein
VVLLPAVGNTSAVALHTLFMNLKTNHTRLFVEYVLLEVKSKTLTAGMNLLGNLSLKRPEPQGQAESQGLVTSCG